MLRYQYVLANTGAAQGDFLRTADTWANQTRILKQNFQQLGSVIGGTFINALKPMVKALNSAMSHIIAFAKTVSNALGKIFGWTYEEGGGGVANDMEYAAGSSEDLAGGLSDAEKNAKKLKSHLLGIDELNVLEPDTGDSSSGSGGGAGGTGGASADGGQWVKSESILKSFESELDTLYKLGEYIGNKLSEAMEKIDWKKTYKKAENWGKGLADFLNGLISPRLFSNLGKTVAGSLNTALHFLNSFGKTFEWEEFGYSLSSGLRGFLETWDAELTSATFSTAARGILQSLKGAIDGLREENVFNQIGQKIVDFICGIDWLGVTWDLGGLLWALAKAIIELPIDLVSGILEGGTKQLSQALVDKIFGEEKIEIDFSGWSFKESFIEAFGLDEISKYFKNWWTGVKKRWKNHWENDIKPFFDIKNWLELANGIVEGITTKIEETKNKASEKFEEIRRTISEKVTSAKESVTEKFENIRRTISEKVTSAKTTVTTKFEEIRKTISDKATEAKTNVTTAFENIRKTISDKIDLIKTKLSGFKDAIDNVIKKIKEFFGFDGERLSIGLPTSAFDSFKEKVSSVIQKLRDFLSFDGKSVSVSATTHYSESGREHDGGGRGFATGGFPEPATYFWAGENGVPEILGTVGGRTAVAGGAEITGIREAVYDVGQNETALLQMAVSLLEVIASKDTSVNIDGRTLVSAYDERKARNGFSFT